MTTGAPALLADIGGSNARFALLDGNAITDIRIFPTGGHDTLGGAALAYLDGRPVDRAALAVAGPVKNGAADLTNAGWSFSETSLSATFGDVPVRIVNDFVAQAMALPALRKGDLRAVGGGKEAAGAPKAVLGPGTGLGVAALVPTDGGWLPLATEGGHVTLPASNREEEAIIDRLRERFGHVSAERVVSGPGLLHLIRAITDISGVPVSYDTPEDVVAAAIRGRDPQAVRALGLFCDFLGTVAADLALSLGAAGGVYIAGGIVPKLGDAFADSGFRRRFEAKGRFSDYLSAIPTWVVTAENPAFVGLRALIEKEG